MTAAGDNEKMALSDEKKPVDDIELGNVDSDDKVQFINGRAGTPDKGNDEFVGLSKQELEKFAKDPYWIKVRLVLLIAFWVGWIIMLGVAVAIIVLTPKCPPEPNLDWWQKSPVYHIIPQSFKDSDGDGIGDLKGIMEKLTYIHETVNASTIMLNSFFEMDDFGVTDYLDIESTIGTMDEFKSLRVSAHKKGIKIILDFDPNHTSNNHSWFVNSRKCKGGVTNEFCDFYIWHAGRGSNPPNDWKNFYNQPAWTYDAERGEYFYHYYLPEQPDLNLRSEAVKLKLQEVIKHWVGNNVDGFRVRDVEHLIEAEFTQDRHAIATTEQCGYADQKETTLQPETFALLTEWRQLLNDLSKDTTTKVLVTDVQEVNNSSLNFFQYNSKPGVHMVYVLLNLFGQSARNIQERVTQVQSALGANSYGWKMGDENHRRATGKYPPEDDYASALNLLLLTLDGTRRSYYGEEIGMRDGSVSWNQARDKGWGQAKYAQCSRDVERTPMQWSGTANGGFSATQNTWLPVSPGTNTINVMDQLATGAGHTTVEAYGNAVRLVSVPSILWGKTTFCRPNEDVVSFVRDASGFNSVYVAVNVGSNPSLLHVVADCSLKDAVKSGFVIGNTGNVDESDLGVGKELSLTHPILLKPRQGIVLEWSWKTSA